jgi:hypothetical protein
MFLRIPNALRRMAYWLRKSPIVRTLSHLQCPNRAESEVLNMVRLENILKVSEAKPDAGLLGRRHDFTP